VAMIRLRPGRKHLLALVSLVVALLIVATSTNAASSFAPREPVTIQLLTASDWHAQLDPLSVTGVGNGGGAAPYASPAVSVSELGFAARSACQYADSTAAPPTLPTPVTDNGSSWACQSEAVKS
jgi:2',3'-cyclic-nucleotide 2'-phosphodiesterase (5'-nucleotidase family)